MKQFTQDGNVYEFPDDWLVVPAYDELPFFKHLSGNQAIMAKGCDFVAVCGDELWLIEAKDYDRKSMKETRPKSTELATIIGDPTGRNFMVRMRPYANTYLKNERGLDRQART